MKNITFSAEETDIEQARSLARLRGTTLNEEFRAWLASYASADSSALKKTQTLDLIEQLTAKQSGTPAIPIAYTYATADQRTAVRDAFNDREQRMLERLERPQNMSQNQGGPQ
jgi:hypothetical protein